MIVLQTLSLINSDTNTLLFLKYKLTLKLMTKIKRLHVVQYHIHIKNTIFNEILNLSSRLLGYV